MSGGSVSAGPPDRSRAARRLWLRLPLLAGGGVDLVLGVATGLQRLGWGSIDSMASLAELHGPLMVCGFFGTVIAIERAVAMGRGWAYLGPLAAVLAGIAAVAGLPAAYAQAGWLAAGLVLLTASCVVAARHLAPFTVLLAVGAAGWPIGTFNWAIGAPIQSAVLWWMSFLVLTIAAERLELNRVLRPTVASQRVFALLVALLLVAAIIAAPYGIIAWRIAGTALLGLAAWLGRYDIARRTIRLPGLPRYAAACLLSGYAWLAVAGLTVAVLDVHVDRLAYDAALHAVFLGFVFAMVFGHAPIILPAVTGAQVPFGSVLYGPLAVLNLAVATRVGGDLLGALELRRCSGILTAAAIVFFVTSMAGLAANGRPARRICAGTKTDSADGATLAP